MMCRIDPNFHEIAIEKTGCRTMDFTKRPMKGYLMIDETGMKTKKNLTIGLIYVQNLTAKQNLQRRKKNKFIFINN